MGVYELLDMNAELAEKLRHDDSQGFVESAERAPGYQPLVMVAHEHASNGLTSIEEMLRLAGEVPDDVLDHPPVLEIDD
jgi:MSHA biogenesis protein MshE